ncbi:DUF5123 domain-containing protein [Alkalitalea saponilacus]|nr:DUF5123 domain-containing protein [Alkalitalea saponilacus]
MRTKFTALFTFLFLGYVVNAQMTTIDLTGSDDPEILQTTLDGLTEPSHIILQAGSYHEISSVSLSFSLKIEGAEGEPAEIKIAGWFNIAAPEDEVEKHLELIAFKNLILLGGNPTGDYVMNISNSGKIDEIVFEDCIVHSFRGVARLRPVEVGLFRVDNCIVRNIAGYGLVNLDDDNGSLTDVEITNSTIAIVERIVVSKTPVNSVKIHDCTFYQTPRNGRAFIDMADASSVIEGGVEVINSILTSGLNGDPNNGVRAGEATPVTITNSYYTNDFDWNALQWRTESENPLIYYDGTAATLFANAAEFDFTIIDGSFAGITSAGDPRFYGVASSIGKSAVSSVKSFVTGGQLVISETVAVVEIFSISGQLVKTAKNVSVVDLSAAASGFYIAKIIDRDGMVSTLKFSK